jgi:hypothetical protein
LKIVIHDGGNVKATLAADLGPGLDIPAAAHLAAIRKGEGRGGTGESSSVLNVVKHEYCFKRIFNSSIICISTM